MTDQAMLALLAELSHFDLQCAIDSAWPTGNLLPMAESGLAGIWWYSTVRVTRDLTVAEDARTIK